MLEIPCTRRRMTLGVLLGIITVLVTIAGCGTSTTTSDRTDAELQLAPTTVVAPAETSNPPPSTESTPLPDGITAYSNTTDSNTTDSNTTTSTTILATSDLQTFSQAAFLTVELLYQFNGTPLAMATLPDTQATLYFALRDGRVVALRDGETQQVLSFEGGVSTLSELGLTGLAFSPNARRLFTFSHDSFGSNLTSRIHAWDLNHVSNAQTPNPQLTASNPQLILEIPQPFANHNGGDITFGPDGYLYVALGDGGSAFDPLGSGQDTSTLLGSILRIDPSDTSDTSNSGNNPGSDPYAIPPDNPFAGASSVGANSLGSSAGGSSTGASSPGSSPLNNSAGAPEIWLYGVRNPWRISFDKATGDLWIADVGQNSLEEINFLPASKGTGRGANLGWDLFEGSKPLADATSQALENHVLPIWEYSHTSELCSITGGYLYRGQQLSDYQGAYVYGDYCTSEIFAFLPGAAHRVAARLPNGDRPVSFGQDNDGELYVLTIEGRVYRLLPGSNR